MRPPPPFLSLILRDWEQSLTLARLIYCAIFSAYCTKVSHISWTGRKINRRLHHLLRIHRSYFLVYSDVLVLMTRTTRALRCEGNCNSKTQSRVIGFEARALSSVLWSQEQIRSVVTSINSRQYFCSMRNWLALDNPNRENDHLVSTSYLLIASWNFLTTKFPNVRV